MATILNRQPPLHVSLRPATFRPPARRVVNLRRRIFSPYPALAILLVLVLLLLIQRPFFSPCKNAGLLVLGQATNTTPYWVTEESTKEIAAKAETLLRCYVETNPAETTSRRGLGLTLAVQEQETEAVEEWQKVGTVTHDFQHFADQARRDGDYTQAAKWYGFIYELAPTYASAYYAGLMQERLGNWANALAIYQEALQDQEMNRPETTASVDGDENTGASTLYYQSGFIHQWHEIPVAPQAAYEAYLTGLEKDSFLFPWQKTETYYRLGEVSEQLELDSTLAIDWYQQAVAANSDHYWAVFRLANVMFRSGTHTEATLNELKRVLAIWPEDASLRWPYLLLGDMLREQNEYAAAARAYAEVLRWDTENESAQAALQEIESFLTEQE